MQKAVMKYTKYASIVYGIEHEKLLKQRQDKRTTNRQKEMQTDQLITRPDLRQCKQGIALHICVHVKYDHR